MKRLSGNKIMPRMLFLIGILLTLSLAVAETTDRVLLVEPEATLNYLKPDNPAEQLQIWVQIWRELLSAGDYEVVTGSEAALLSLDEFKLVILPGTLCLDNSEIISLHEFAAKKGGILAVWAAGSRHKDGKWRGYDFLEYLLGAAPEETDYQLGTPLSLQIKHGQPGTNLTPPGYYLRTIPYVTPFYLSNTEKVRTLGYWAENGYRDQATMIDMMIRDFERITDLGGLFKINYHSQLLSKPDYVEVLEMVIKLVKRNKNIWIASAGDISRWIRQINLLSIESSYGNDEIRISVTNNSKLQAENSALEFRST